MRMLKKGFLKLESLRQSGIGSLVKRENKVGQVAAYRKQLIARTFKDANRGLNIFEFDTLFCTYPAYCFSF